MQERAIPDDIRERRDKWLNLFRGWNIGHYALGITSVVCSVTAAAIANIDEFAMWQIPLTIIAGICAGLITFMKPANRARPYIRAWRLLDAACTRYSLNHQYPIQSVIDAKEKGEQIIQDGVASE